MTESDDKNLCESEPLQNAIKTESEILEKKLLNVDENHEVIITDGLESTFQPPDGGIRAWLVMVSAFLCNGIIFGTINSSGIIYEKLQGIAEDNGDPNASFKASMVASLAIGNTFFFSILSGVLCDKFGIRNTSLLGGSLATLGMILSAFFCDQMEVLMITYGIMFGCGSSLAYTPSLVILGHYFQRWMGMVNGFVTAGSSVFTIAMPFILPILLQSGLKTTFLVLAALTSCLMACALVFKSLMPNLNEKKRSEKKRCCCHWSEVINVNIWRNKSYVIWATAVPLALFGYFVPYVHLVKYVNDVLGEKEGNGKTLVQCIGATSGLGRIVFGFIADRPRVNRIFLQQISFVTIGVLTMLLTTCNNFTIFVFICLGMGLFDGCFISLLGPIAFDIVGGTGASQAIGSLLALCSIPLTVGPAVAGALYDILKSYQIPFICAGIPPIVGAIALCAIHYLHHLQHCEQKKTNTLKEKEPGHEMNHI